MLEIVDRATARCEELLVSLADRLTDADDGLKFIYDVLAAVVTELGVSDAIVVLEEPGFGRQLFRVHRRRLDDPWSERLLIAGQPAFHTRPHELDHAMSTRLMRLCSLALRLEAARYDARHDPLTGVYNRRAFNELLAAACARAARDDDARFVLALIDLDKFKMINDTLGHAAGDNVLRALGAELRHHVRTGDAVARVGGDEFALMLPGAPAREGLDFIGAIIERVEAGLASTVIDLDVHVSCGIAEAPGDSSDPNELSRIADERLNREKSRTHV